MRRRRLLVPQRRHRRHAHGATGWKIARHERHCGQHDRDEEDRQRIGQIDDDQESSERQRHERAQHETGHQAPSHHPGAFSKHQPAHVGGIGAERQSNADLARTLGGAVGHDA